MRARGLVDVLIPRGGAGLIRSVVEESTVPVIETGVGNCHVYVDRAADLDKALAIVLNAKTQRTSVCNAAESLLVHADVADDVPAAGRRRAAGGRRHHPRRRRVRGVRRRRGGHRRGLRDRVPLPRHLRAPSCPTSTRRSRTSGATPAGTPTRSSPRTRRAARRFTAAVDSAAVLVNASTRFTDGGEFGFGAEIGISTQKLHARGPMGLPEMTSTKYVVTGDGHVR